MKCKVCGKKFKLTADKRYEVVKRPVGFSCLTTAPVTYEAFDCPHCGCQNVVNVREENYNTFTSTDEAEDEDDLS